VEHRVLAIGFRYGDEPLLEGEQRHAVTALADRVPKSLNNYAVLRRLGTGGPDRDQQQACPKGQQNRTWQHLVS
jgi:hypothetical protein